MSKISEKMITIVIFLLSCVGLGALMGTLFNLIGA